MPILPTPTPTPSHAHLLVPHSLSPHSLARSPPPLTCLCHPHACSLTAPPHLLALWPTRMMLEALAGADLTLPYTDSGEFLVSAGGGFIGSFLGFRV